MAPTLTNTFQTNFAKKVEELLGQRAVFMAVRGTEAEGVLKANKGRTHNYLTLTEGTAQDYTPYSDATIDDFTVAADTLTLTSRPMYTFKWDTYDGSTHQAAGSILERQTSAAQKKIERDISGNFFTGAVTATSVVGFDDGDIGGTAGTAISWNPTNVPAIFTEARAKVRSNSGESGGDFMTATPSQIAKLEQSIIANGFRTSDEALERGLKIGKNGYVGNYLGVDLFECDFVTKSYVITYGATTNNPSNGETLTVGGVTFTSVSAIGTTAGNFLIETNAVDTWTNFKNFINDPLTTSAKQVALSAANARIIRGWKATQETTPRTITLYSKWGTGTVTESMSNTTLGSARFHNILGKYGAIEEAHPMGILTKIGNEPKQTVENFLTFTYSGVAVPTNNLQRYVAMTVAA